MESSRKQKKEGNTTRFTLCILHNCAKNPHLRQHLRDLDTVRVLSRYMHGADTEMKLVILLTLSYIMDEDDNNSVLANCDEMLFLLEGIGGASGSKLHIFQNWHLHELLQGVMNLAKNEDNKKLLVEMDALRYLKPVIKDGNDNEKLLAMKTTWQLAFAEENKTKIKEDGELMKLVHGAKNDWPADSEMSTCARGILFVLNIDSITKSSEDLTLLEFTQQTTSGDRQRPGHVMISYQHFSRDILKKVCRYLRQRQYRVWMDVDSIGGHSSTLEAMAKAVEDADAVLLCMSEHYKDSANCRLEAEYAFDKGKVMIPLLMQKGYKPDGWLGILKGSKLYIDFSGKYSFEEQIQKLLAELGGRGRDPGLEVVDGPVVCENSSILMAPSIPVKAKTSSSQRGVGQWSPSEVAQWLQSHRLQGCQHLQNLSGENLVCLQKLRREVPEFFFNFLKQDFELSSFDLLHFSDAVDQAAHVTVCCTSQGHKDVILS
ncbi:uncharacterized protein LOC112554707 isoform X1 [Pomacea canaliculata]|uniref:uncharacterized protein LOC112554707 isoform X1 n=2 Tax=Pomacea canaliculata TaxID=400727 RepID=UPI000D72B5FA|nr:uncharacterized protein LOC112554707 isoform X1 [Pomacea canaliculata]XP_025078462.1 uncharacterized protein LOC112554707 isoform X1 [Pomacea canaliculata]